MLSRVIYHSAKLINCRPALEIGQSACPMVLCLHGGRNLHLTSRASSTKTSMASTIDSDILLGVEPTHTTMSFPVPDATTSFWRTQLHELDTSRSTEEIPAEVDIVVIGAGYSGASIVHHLLKHSRVSGRDVSIAILEAREACSGATGRNGMSIETYWTTVLLRHFEAAI